MCDMIKTYTMHVLNSQLCSLKQSGQMVNFDSAVWVSFFYLQTKKKENYNYIEKAVYYDMTSVDKYLCEGSRTEVSHC